MASPRVPLFSKICRPHSPLPPTLYSGSVKNRAARFRNGFSGDEGFHQLVRSLADRPRIMHHRRRVEIDPRGQVFFGVREIDGFCTHHSLPSCSMFAFSSPWRYLIYTSERLNVVHGGG
jgi:hypothetical protein